MQPASAPAEVPKTTPTRSQSGLAQALEKPQLHHDPAHAAAREDDGDITLHGHTCTSP